MSLLRLINTLYREATLPFLAVHSFSILQVYNVRVCSFKSISFPFQSNPFTAWVTSSVDFTKVVHFCEISGNMMVYP